MTDGSCFNDVRLITLILCLKLSFYVVTIVIFAFASGGDIRAIMLGALDAGYLDGYHVFITVDVVEGAYIGANTFMGDDGRDDEANMAFDALFNVHIRKPKTERYAEFERKVREKTALPPFNNHIDDNTEVTSLIVNLYTTFIFWAILHVVLALLVCHGHQEDQLFLNFTGDLF